MKDGVRRKRLSKGQSNDKGRDFYYIFLGLKFEVEAQGASKDIVSAMKLLPERNSRLGPSTKAGGWMGIIGALLQCFVSLCVVPHVAQTVLARPHLQPGNPVSCNMFRKKDNRKESTLICRLLLGWRWRCSKLPWEKCDTRETRWPCSEAIVEI